MQYICATVKHYQPNSSYMPARPAVKNIAKRCHAFSGIAPTGPQVTVMCPHITAMCTKCPEAKRQGHAPLVTLKAPMRKPSPPPSSKIALPRTMGMMLAIVIKTLKPTTASGASRSCWPRDTWLLASAEMAAKKPTMARRPLISSAKRSLSEAAAAANLIKVLCTTEARELRWWHFHATLPWQD